MWPGQHNQHSAMGPSAGAVLVTQRHCTGKQPTQEPEGTRHCSVVPHAGGDIVPAQPLPQPMPDAAQSHGQTPALAWGRCWLGEWPQDHGLAHPTASHGAHGCSLPCPTLGLFHSPAPVLGTEVINASLQRLSKPLHCWQHHGSPRLYHMSRMAAPILALMSPYLPGWGVVSITLQLGTVHGMSASRPGGHAQPERLIPKSLPAQHGCRLGLEPQPERQSSGRRGQE